MNRWIKIVAASLVVVLCFGLVGKMSPAWADTAFLKALIVNGQMNRAHGWKVSSPILKRILEQAGLFKVDFATSPPKGGNMENFKPNFAAYDVVVLDYDGDYWSEQTKAAFVEYARSGGGVVVYHSANNAFPKWKEFNEITGLGGWGGRDEKSGPMVRFRDGKVVLDSSPGKAGSHPPKHEYQVVIRDREHPITAGLPERWMHAADELYGKLRGPAKNLRVLATAYSDPAKRNGTGEHEPVLFTIRYREGRVFHTVLGHVGSKDSPPLPPVECVGFIVTLQRGTEWAATGKVTQKVPDDFPTATEVRMRDGFTLPRQLDELLAKVTRYDYGQSREALTELTELVRDAYDSPGVLKRIEERFLSLLRSDATLAAKQFICRQLSIIGTEEAVPTLAAMLTETATVDMARYALERIPGPAVDKALRDALEKTSGRVKVGIINSLGERGDIKAVEALSKELLAADYKCVSAATTALGKIGGEEAASALKEMLQRALGNWRIVLADAYLMCADRFLADGDKESALEIYKQMQTTEEPEPIRVAALRGIVTTTGEKAVGVIVGILTGKDQAMQTAAIKLIRNIPGTRIIKAAAAELPNLSVTSQVQLISALGDRGDPVVLPEVINATKSTEEPVRTAALKALGQLGDASSVILLAHAAGFSRGAERDAARESLYSIQGLKVDETIAKGIGETDSKVEVELVRGLELIRSVSHRNIKQAVEVLLKTAKDSEAGVRLESIKVLKDIAEEKHLPALLELLMSAQNEGERKETERTVVAVAHKIDDKNRRARAVLAVLPSVNNVKVRCSLLSVLGRIGDSNALGVLREALEDNNAEVQAAAVRALSEWPGAEPMAELLNVVQTSDNKIHRVLALRGFIRLIGLESERPAKETVKLYKQAMDLSSNVSERTMVLSGLANVKSFAALEMAASYLDDKSLQREAEAAVVKIAEATGGKGGPEETRRVLQKVLKITKNASLRKQAQKVINQIK